MCNNCACRAWRSASASTPCTRNSCPANRGSWDDGWSSWRTRRACTGCTASTASTGWARAPRPVPLAAPEPPRLQLSSQNGAAFPSARLARPRQPAPRPAPGTPTGLRAVPPSRSPVSILLCFVCLLLFRVRRHCSPFNYFIASGTNFIVIGTSRDNW